MCLKQQIYQIRPMYLCSVLFMLVFIVAKPVWCIFVILCMLILQIMSIKFTLKFFVCFIFEPTSSNTFTRKILQDFW